VPRVAFGPYFTDRDYISAGAPELANNLDALPGRIAYKGGDGKYKFMTTTVIDNNVTPQTKAVQSAYYYSSVIDKGFTGAGNFPVVTVDTTGATSTDYELRDVATVLIPDSGEPTRAEFQAAATKAQAPSGALYWVSGAALSDLRQKVAVNLNGKTTISGQAFSVSGSVYDSNVQADWIPLISVYVIPMNSAADAEVAALRPGGPVLPPATLEARVRPRGLPNVKMDALLSEFKEVNPQNIASWPSPFPARLSHGPNGLVPATIQ
jgi:hypothetical protein